MNSIKTRKRPTIPDNLPQLLDERQTAAYLGVSRSFLRKSRCEGQHHARTEAPAFVRVGGRVLYRRADIEAWVTALEARSHI
jgi:predicted DNA-binding transcriptional regulator AlpA